MGSAPAITRTDGELAHAAASYGFAVGSYLNGLRAVYDLGRADRETELTCEVAARIAEYREHEAQWCDRIRDLEDELARLRARAEP